MSKASKKISALIKAAFPSYRLVEEHYVHYQNTRLLFDFYLPELKVLIEVQGDQHFTFNSFHYHNKKNFTDQQMRDKLKTQWADEEGLRLLCLTEAEVDVLNAKSFRKKIIATI